MLRLTVWCFIVLVSIAFLIGFAAGIGIGARADKKQMDEEIERTTAMLDFSSRYEADIRYLQDLGASRKLAEIIYDTAVSEGLPVHVVGLLVRAESRFDSLAVSPVGAVGLCQVMPSTARLYGFSPERLKEAAYNIKAGCRIFAAYYREAGDLGRALVAYNAGPRWIGKKDLPRETRRYASLIEGAYAAL
jgi:soluble lytic murein transglycosylase-like protein